jgi:glycosyltransferase involved in cell wall biosynthesis
MSTSTLPQIGLKGEMSKKTVIVIPCFNEAARLNESLFDGLIENPDIELLFVDDGSSDRTGDALRSWAERHPHRSRVLVLAKNSGKGEAVRQGILTAIEMNPAYFGYVDSDGATPASECARLLEALEAAPGQVLAVLGSRIRHLGSDIRRQPSRHYLGRVFATGASLMLRLPVYDTQCGAKFFRNQPIVREAFQEVFHSRWFFDVELVGRLSLAVLAAGGQPEESIVEEPLRVWHDISGSRRSFWVYGWAAVDLVRISHSLRRKKSSGFH